MRAPTLPLRSPEVAKLADALERTEEPMVPREPPPSSSTAAARLAKSAILASGRRLTGKLPGYSSGTPKWRNWQTRWRARRNPWFPREPPPSSSTAAARLAKSAILASRRRLTGKLPGYSSGTPKWRNWQTRWTQNPVERELRVGSIPTFGTHGPRRARRTSGDRDTSLPVSDTNVRAKTPNWQPGSGTFVTLSGVCLTPV